MDCPVEAEAAPSHSDRPRLQTSQRPRPWCKILSCRQMYRQTQRVMIALVVAGLGCALVGCGGPQVRGMQLEELAGAPKVDPEFEYLPEYRIRVGDNMRIEFLSDPEPSTSASEVVVRPDGRISLRGVDDVLAASRTPAELDSVLTARFQRLLVDPELSVIVESFSREKLYVLGEVERPQEIDLVGPTSLLQAIAAAGGFTVGANRNDVVVVRRLPGGRLAAFKIDAEPIMEGTEGAREIALHAQDVVIVPKTKIAKVGDFVTQYFENLNPALLTAFWIDRLNDE